MKLQFVGTLSLISISALMISACDMIGSSGPEQSESNNVVSETPPPEPPKPIVELVAGGVVNVNDFAATTVGRRISSSDLLIEEASEYVTVASDRSRTCVGPKNLVRIKPGAIYVVDAQIELLDEYAETRPTITAWSHTEDRQTIDRGWSVQYFPPEAVPINSVVSLQAKYSTEAAPEVKAFQSADLVKFGRFCVGPYSGGSASGQKAKFYSVTVTEIQNP